MTEAEEQITISILDHHYSVKCPASQSAQLQQSARYVEEQMKKLCGNKQAQHIDSLAVVAALNISHELLQLKAEKNQLIDTMNQHIGQLQNKIETFLAATEEVAV